jgi:hypothetical protein
MRWERQDSDVGGMMGMQLGRQDSDEGGAECMLVFFFLLLLSRFCILVH